MISHCTVGRNITGINFSWGKCNILKNMHVLDLVIPLWGIYNMGRIRCKGIFYRIAWNGKKQIKTRSSLNF